MKRPFVHRSVFRVTHTPHSCTDRESLPVLSFATNSEDPVPKILRHHRKGGTKRGNRVPSSPVTRDPPRHRYSTFLNSRT